jgi:hypothetical protein
MPKRGSRHHKAPALVVGNRRQPVAQAGAAEGAAPWQVWVCRDCGQPVWIDALELAPHHNRAVLVLCEECAQLRG